MGLTRVLFLFCSLTRLAILLPAILVLLTGARLAYGNLPVTMVKFKFEFMQKLFFFGIVTGRLPDPPALLHSHKAKTVHCLWTDGLNWYSTDAPGPCLGPAELSFSVDSHFLWHPIFCLPQRGPCTKLDFVFFGFKWTLS